MSSEKMTYKEIFLKAIRAALENGGLKQKELASAIGTSPGLISQYRTGKKTPAFDNAEKIASAYGMDVVEFLAMGRAVELWAEGRVPEAAKKLVPNPEAAQAAAQKIVAETAAGSVDELQAKYFKALEQIAAQAAELSALRAELDALKQEGAARAPLSAPAPASASGSENAA